MSLEDKTPNMPFIDHGIYPGSEEYGFPDEPFFRYNLSLVPIWEPNAPNAYELMEKIKKWVDRKIDKGDSEWKTEEWTKMSFEDQKKSTEAQFKKATDEFDTLIKTLRPKLKDDNTALTVKGTENTCGFRILKQCPEKLSKPGEEVCHGIRQFEFTGTSLGKFVDGNGGFIDIAPFAEGGRKRRRKRKPKRGHRGKSPKRKTKRRKKRKSKKRRTKKRRKRRRK
jgi:hypothetical protein